MLNLFQHLLRIILVKTFVIYPAEDPDPDRCWDRMTLFLFDRKRKSFKSAKIRGLNKNRLRHIQFLF